MSVLYQRGDICIDNDFARFGAKSYAIDKIYSLEVRRQKAFQPWQWLIGIAAVIVGIGLTDFSAIGAWIGRLALFIGMVAAWYYFYKHPNLDKLSLFFMTSSSEAQAFQTTDISDIKSLQSAIEQAMTAKGH